MTDTSFIESEERRALRKAVAALGANYGADYYLEKARSGGHTDELWREAGELGFIGVNLPEEYGGGGAGMYELSLVMEELSTAGCPLLMMVVSPAINGTIIAKFGTDEQRKRWVPGIADGSITMAFAITEPDAGSDVAGIRTRAERVEGGYRLTGSKIWISNANLAEFFVVFAKTAPDGGHRGMSAFIVPRASAGLTVGEPLGKLGQRCSPTCEVFLDQVFVPEDHRLGEEGGGFGVAQSRLAGGRLHHAMRSIGVAQRAIDMMGRRAKSRFTQGSVLADKQLIQEFVADSYIELAQFRLLVLHAAWLVDTQGEHAAREAIAACKIQTANVLKSIGLRAIQVHGGLGLTDQMPLSSVLFGGIALGLADGPTEAHKVNLARMVLKGYEPEDPVWPSEFMTNRIERAREKYGHLVDRIPALPVSP